jgi:circadian clock protein KaiA
LVRSQDVYYHTAEAHLSLNEIASMPQMIDRAIAEFLKLSPQCRLPISETLEADLDFSPSMLQATLSTQQRRLSEKLKERLGYLGIYYKRDSQLFFRNLSKSDREHFLNELRLDYRDIILDYFREGSDINQKIDSFVNKVFFADLSVSQVLELHMEFMDRLSKKLKLEGRNEDVLLDYRLTLIDTIAHLCEMYRRSIPRKPHS